MKKLEEVIESCCVNNDKHRIDNEIIAIVKDFFDFGGVSYPINQINFLINDFICNDSFLGRDARQNQDVIFGATEAINFIAKLHDKFEARKRVIIDQNTKGENVNEV